MASSWDVDNQTASKQGASITAVTVDATDADAGALALEFDSLGHLTKASSTNVLVPQRQLFIELTADLDASAPGGAAGGSPLKSATAKALYWVSAGQSIWGAIANKTVTVWSMSPKLYLAGERGIAVWHCASARWWIVEMHEFGCWAKLTSRNGTAYTWEEVAHAGGNNFGAVAWTKRSGTDNAYDVNGASHNCAGGAYPSIVWLRRGATGSFVFDVNHSEESPGERKQFTP